jgi:hypothetical protein
VEWVEWVAKAVEWVAKVVEWVARMIAMAVTKVAKAMINHPVAKVDMVSNSKVVGMEISKVETTKDQYLLF